MGIAYLASCPKHSTKVSGAVTVKSRSINWSHILLKTISALHLSVHVCCLLSRCFCVLSWVLSRQAYICLYYPSNWLASAELHICVTLLSFSFHLPSCSSLSLRQPSYEHLLCQQINYLSVLRAGESIPCHYYSVSKRNRTEAYIGFTRAEHFNFQPKVIRRALCSVISLQHLIFSWSMFTVIWDLLFVSWQHSVTTLVGWSRGDKVK